MSRCPTCGQAYLGVSHYQCNCKPHYGFFNFIGDVIMVLFTGGLWLIWIFVREMRKR